MFAPAFKSLDANVALVKLGRLIRHTKLQSVSGGLGKFCNLSNHPSEFTMLDATDIAG
jgi:hypothetical protein